MKYPIIILAFFLQYYSCAQSDYSTKEQESELRQLETTVQSNIERVIETFNDFQLDLQNGMGSDYNKKSNYGLAKINYRKFAGSIGWLSSNLRTMEYTISQLDGCEKAVSVVNELNGILMDLKKKIDATEYGVFHNDSYTEVFAYMVEISMELTPILSYQVTVKWDEFAGEWNKCSPEEY